MITATSWVPRGYAAQFPRRYEFDQDEMDRIANMTQDMVLQAREDMAEAAGEAEDEEEEQKITSGASNGASSKASKKSKKSKKDQAAMSEDDAEDDDIINDDDLKEYDLENYDHEDEEVVEGPNGEQKGDAMGFFGSVKNLAYYQNDDDDPYVTLPAASRAAEDEDEEEREELQILKSDSLILAGRVEDEVSHLEVYVYEDAEDNLYVHHDVMLPAIPLAVEWLDFPVGDRILGQKDRTRDMDAERDTGNFVAIGTMDPDIEIWDLDVVDSMYPNAILGQAGGTAPARTGKKKRRTKKPHAEYHVDAVLALAANRQHRNLLASASADTTVKLWDLQQGTAAHSYALHTDKVCALAWHPSESTTLLSGGYDARVAAGDMRAPEQGVRQWQVDSDVESVRWDPHDGNYFYAACDSGMLFYFDARVVAADAAAATSKPVWRLQAHDAAVSAFDAHPGIPGFLATGSSDKQVKLWNVQPGGVGPSMVVSRDLGVGRVFSTGFAPDHEIGWRLAVAGSEGGLQVWDTSTNRAVRGAFAGRMRDAGKEVEEKVVGVELEDDSGSSGSEGEEGGADEDGEDEDEDEDSSEESDADEMSE